MKIQRRSQVLNLALALATLAFGLTLHAQAQTFTSLASFGSFNGANPYSGLIQGYDGNLYGTEANYGAFDGGTAFRLTTAGRLQDFYNFCQSGVCTSVGFSPLAGLVQSNGNFYGTTLNSGGANAGAVYKLTPSGVATNLHYFSGSDGNGPYAALLLASDGNFYGTTYSGGAFNYGTVFRITPAGSFTLLHSFNQTDGEAPINALVQGNGGFFYGTTNIGGANGNGTVFKISPSGTFTVLHSFNVSDGSNAIGGLVLGRDGNFYGTTETGGSNAYGTVFKITPSGTFTTLHSFIGSDGSYPEAGLIQASDGNFYGITGYGGAGGSCYDNCGTIFEITPSGTFTTLHDFVGGDGYLPLGALFQATNGTIYGTTWYGGAGYGTAYSLNVGLGPLVEPEPAFGRVGATSVILGNNLTGTTAVSFNGTAATFTVVSNTEIKATVPAGATSGTVQVTTPSGTLNSNPIFHVTP
jgi:uncharacterized repeat protein (TIGR03803 family)